MTDLKDAVDAAAKRAELAPVQRTAFDQVRRNETVLKTIGLNPADPKAQAVVAVCDRYGLDPVLGHIMILGQGNLPYITRDGFIHIAHRSGQLDGIEVSDPHREGAQWVTHASVYRKDMSRPFTYPGSADVGRDNGPEMAIARAERRALKRAFAVTLPREFAEDEYDTRQSPTAPPVASPGDASPPAEPGEAPDDVPLPATQAEDYPEDYWDQPVPAKMVAEIHARLRDIGITDRPGKLAFYTDTLGRPVKTTKELTLGEGETVLTAARDRQYAQHADDHGEAGEDAD
jgi:hypothetical protein